MGDTCKPMAVSFQCMTKFTTKKKKSHRFETEELMFQFDSEGRKRLVSQLKVVRAGVFSYSQENMPFCSIHVLN